MHYEFAFTVLFKKGNAQIAMRAYHIAGEFAKAAEFARITGSTEAKSFEALATLIQ